MGIHFTLGVFGAMNEIKFVKSKRGGYLVELNDFLFRLERKKKNTAYYKCESSSKTKCNARIVIETTPDSSAIKRTSGIHNHNKPVNKIQKMKFCAKLKERAISESTVPVPRIYKEEVAESATSDEKALCLPNFETAQKFMYKARASVIPKLPHSKMDINLPEVWTKTKNGDDFLLIDDGTEENRILVFGTRENLFKLCMSERIYLDGTFKVVPKLFSQLYSLHGIYMGQVFPLIFALLPNKTEETYLRLIVNLKSKAHSFGLKFEPRQCMLDFEVASINALKNSFPGCIVKGCFFHYTQCIWRKVQQLGLVGHYKNNEDVKKWIRRIAALPLVPEHEVTEAFLWLQENEPDVPQTIEMNNYLAETWLDECLAKFPMDLWNHFENDQARTNNYVEGFHSKLNKRAGHPHLNIFSFIDLIRTLQIENEGVMRMLHVGTASTPKKKTVYKRINEKIAMLKNEFLSNNITLMYYMDCIGHYLHLES